MAASRRADTRTGTVGPSIARGPDAIAGRAPCGQLTVTTRVLIADTDADARLRHQDTLAGLAWEFIEAADGRDALTKPLVSVPSLVITELRLPILDGFALCEILRRDRTTADVPILVVTADARWAKREPVQRTADAVLVKPTSPEIAHHAASCAISASRKSIACGGLKTPSAPVLTRLDRTVLCRLRPHVVT